MAETKAAEKESRGAGGTPGGCGTFALGMTMAAAGLWFFFDSVRVSTGGFGAVSGVLGGGYRGYGGYGLNGTTSMGLIFVPFFLGVLALAYDARQKWAWALSLLGLIIIIIEILSRLQFEMSMKSSHLLLLIVLFAAGLGMMLRSFRPFGD